MSASLTHDDVGEHGTMNVRVQRSKERIIAACIELVVEHGARSLTVDAITERSGVAKSTLYRHWPSIDALILDVFRAATPTTLEPDPSEPFETALSQQIEAVARTLADPQWIKVLPELIALRNQYPELGALADQDRATKETAVATILAAGAADGRLPVDLDVRNVVAVLLGPMMICALFGEYDRIEEVGSFTLERFLDSYRP